MTVIIFKPRPARPRKAPEGPGADVIGLCVIRFDGTEYRVPLPGPERDSRDTDNRDTAAKIARGAWGDSVVIRFMPVADSDPDVTTARKASLKKYIRGHKKGYSVRWNTTTLQFEYKESAL